MDYAVRPAVMGRSKIESGRALISGDLIGVAPHYLEAQYGSSATAIFLMGAASDQQTLFTAVRSVFDQDGIAENDSKSMIIRVLFDSNQQPRSNDSKIFAVGLLVKALPIERTSKLIFDNIQCNGWST
jgi:hypothetical protein